MSRTDQYALHQAAGGVASFIYLTKKQGGLVKWSFETTTVKTFFVAYNSLAGSSRSIVAVNL